MWWLLTRLDQRRWCFAVSTSKFNVGSLCIGSHALKLFIPTSTVTRLIVKEACASATSSYHRNVALHKKINQLHAVTWIYIKFARKEVLPFTLDPGGFDAGKTQVLLEDPVQVSRTHESHFQPQSPRLNNVCTPR